MTDKTEFNEKQKRLRALLSEYGLEAVLLRRVSSFAWATCGAASYINMASSEGVASLLVTATGRYLITTHIEAPRFEREEKLVEQGWELRASAWYEPDGAAEMTRTLKLGVDGPYPGTLDLSSQVAGLRAALMPEEGERFRALGRRCAEAIQEAARQVRPGQTEHEIAGLLARETESRGVQGVVNLIATDDRIYNYRHPLPTSKKLERYAMLILCGRRNGLICSVTRFVHFGRLPDELRRKAEAVARIDAALIEATRPGRSLGQVFQTAVSAYAQAGVPDEWRLHHQGGLAGYEPREITVTPGSSETVALGQAYAWNPSITGSKSEDTVLVTPDDNEVLSTAPGWPSLTVEWNGKVFRRPAILEVT